MIWRIPQTNTREPITIRIRPGDVAHIALALADALPKSTGGRFERPEPFDGFRRVLEALSESSPLDTAEAEAPPLFAGQLKLWRRASDLAGKGGAWSELLASTHVLTQSAIVAGTRTETHSRGGSATFDLNEMAERFELNKFQHHEIERQAGLRAALGLRTDIALGLGLAEEGTDEAEDRLRHHTRWIAALAQWSVLLTSDEHGARSLSMPIYPTADGSELPVAATVSEVEWATLSSGTGASVNVASRELVITPWPFAAEAFDVMIPVLAGCARETSGSSAESATTVRFRIVAFKGG